jgi:HAMP domain-containing protein
MLFNRLKIRTRIYAGFTLLIVLGLIIAAVGYWGIHGLGRQNVRMNALSGNLRYTATAMENEELVARIMLRAASDPSEDGKPRFHEALEKIREAMTQAKANTLSALRKQIYQSTLDKLDTQAASGDKSFEVGHAMLEARSRIPAGGEALTAAAKRLEDVARASDGYDDDAAAAQVARAMFLVRIANWRFLATLDKAGLDTFRTSVAAAMAALDDATKFPAFGPLIPPVRAALTTYADAFKATSGSVIELADSYATVQRPMASAMIADLAKAEDSLGQDTLDAATTSTDLRDTTTETQITVAALGLIGGLALAFFIARGIVRPLTGMTNTMTTLAAGDHDVSIPGAERTDEIGDMARAVEVFKTNMIEAERLAAEQEATRAARSRRQDAMDGHTQTFGTSVTAVMAALGNAASNMRKSADVMTEACLAQSKSKRCGTPVMRQRSRPPPTHWVRLSKGFL